MDGELTIHQRANKKRAELARRLAAKQIEPRLEALGVGYDLLSETERKQLIAMSSSWNERHPPKSLVHSNEVQLSSWADVERWLDADFPAVVSSRPVVAELDYNGSPFYRLCIDGWSAIEPVVVDFRALRLFDADTGQTASIECVDDAPDVNFEVDPTLWHLSWFPDDD